MSKRKYTIYTIWKKNIYYKYTILFWFWSGRPEYLFYRKHDKTAALERPQCSFCRVQEPSSSGTQSCFKNPGKPINIRPNS